MTDFSGYLIATDLDGTFLGPHGALVERNLNAIERFKAGGGLFTFDTGRQHYNIEGAIPDPAGLVNAPAVLCNGAYLYDFEKKQVFDADFLDEGLARALFCMIRRDYPELWLRAPASKCVFVACEDERCLRELSSYQANALRRVSGEKWSYDDWFKLSPHGEQASLDALRQEVERLFGDRLYVTSSGDGYIDIQHPSVDKAKGLEKLQRYCGAGRTVIACGDFENDLEMLRSADISVCPENALPSVKAVADYTLCHHADGLIADIVERIERGELSRIQ